MYSDCFSPEEEWLIFSTQAESPRCQVRHSVNINFIKSCMMQSIIQTRAFSAYQSNFKLWCEWVKSKLGSHYDASETLSMIQKHNESARSSKITGRKRRTRSPRVRAESIAVEIEDNLAVSQMTVIEKVTEPNPLL